MTEQEFRNLKVGDVIRNNGSYLTYGVTDNYGSRVTAVRSIDTTNPSMWELVNSKKENDKA